MQNVGSRMNRSAAKSAVTHAKMRLAVRANSLPRPVPHVAVRQEYRLSPRQIVRSTAANALQR